VKPSTIARIASCRRCCRKFTAAILAVSIFPSALAHRVDELLQSTLLSVSPEMVTVEITITPGIEVVDSTLALIDRDRDGKISTAEAETYARRVAKSVELTLDERPLELNVAGQEVAPLADARSGLGLIRVKARAKLGKVAEGRHSIVFRNRHPVSGTVFLANALLPESPSIRVLRQRRDENQSELTVVYRLQSGAVQRR
jgi:hypothetical protein